MNKTLRNSKQRRSHAFHANRAALEAKYGIVTQRPQDRHPKFLEEKRILNTRSRDPYIHPFQSKIDVWYFLPSHLTPAIKDPRGEPIWVDKPRCFYFMVADITTSSHIAVDAEHHVDHSFNGMICLLQISTEKFDYLADTLNPDIVHS